jgi:hypothetical protein
MISAFFVSDGKYMASLWFNIVLSESYAIVSVLDVVNALREKGANYSTFGRRY